MKAVRLVEIGKPLEDARDARARHRREGRPGAGQGRRHLPLGRALPGRGVAGRRAAADAGPRDGRRRGGGRRGVTGVQPGDRVCLHYLLTCGECHYCRTRPRAVLPPGPDDRQTRRRRLCRVHRRAGPQRRPPARRGVVRAGGDHDVLVVHLVSRPAQGPAAARRDGGRLWRRRPGHVGHPTGAGHGRAGGLCRGHQRRQAGAGREPRRHPGGCRRRAIRWPRSGG